MSVRAHGVVGFRGALEEMYAILKHGGHQYRVAPGDRLLVDRLTADVGSKVTLEPVLLVADGDAIAEVGAGAVSGAHVVATVVAHRRGRKLRVFTYKPKKRRRRTLGYRSQLTELRVDEVAPGGGKPAARRTEKPAAEKPPPAKPGETTAAAAGPPAAEAPAASAEPKRRARRAAAEAPAPSSEAEAASSIAASAAAASEPESAGEPEATSQAAAESDVLDAPVETRPAKRASRPRRKADGA